MKIVFDTLKNKSFLHILYPTKFRFETSNSSYIKANDLKHPFFFLSRTTYNDHQAFPLSSSQEFLNHPQFDPSRKTVLYIHGYKQLIDDDNIRTIVAAYQTRNDYNILVLDWISIANGDYLFNALPDTVAVS